MTPDRRGVWHRRNCRLPMEAWQRSLHPLRAEGVSTAHPGVASQIQMERHAYPRKRADRIAADKMFRASRNPSTEANRAPLSPVRDCGTIQEHPAILREHDDRVPEWLPFEAH